MGNWAGPGRGGPPRRGPPRPLGRPGRQAAGRRRGLGRGLRREGRGLQERRGRVWSCLARLGPPPAASLCRCAAASYRLPTRPRSRFCVSRCFSSSLFSEYLSSLLDPPPSETRAGPVLYVSALPLGRWAVILSICLPLSASLSLF